MGNKITYEDGKYSLQDVGTLYVGTKYTFEELLDNEEISFKFRLVVERYLLPEADREDTLETHLYYLDSKSFLVKIYQQLKAKIKVNVIEEKKDRSGKVTKRYVTKTLSPKELTEIEPSAKESVGMVIQEIAFSKLSLMAF